MIDRFTFIIGKHWYRPSLTGKATEICRFFIQTRLLGRRSHSLSQHTQFLKNNMIAENDFL